MKEKKTPLFGNRNTMTGRAMIPEEDKRALEETAKRMGLTVSQLIRMFIDNARIRIRLRKR